MSAVLVARFERRSEVAAILRAALDVDIVYLPLPAPPPSGRLILQVFVGDELIAALSAELVGSGRDGEYPLRLRLLDAAHATELEPFATRASAPQARPSRTFAAPAAREHPGVPDSVVDDKTLPSRQGVAGELPPVSSTEQGPTTVFELDVAQPSRPHDSAKTPALPSGALPSLRTRTPSGRGSFADDEPATLAGQAPRTGGVGAASWNVRIAPTTKDPLCGRAFGGGKYVLDSVIGTGAIGIVYKASHRDLGRTIAIKVLNPRYRDDAELLNVFRAEARAASQLEHPNVARVYDYGQEPDGLVYIVMEYLSGYTLGSVLDVRRKLAAARAIDLMVQVCAALSAAHDRDIVHRDVKPDNIVLVPTQDDEGAPVEIVKVCDFGIAALGRTGIEEGAAVGTPEYMAPEQTTGLAVTPSADVYACGVVLYQMLLGEVPFKDDQAYRIMMMHRDEAPRPPTSLDSSISAALEGVILRCLEKRPLRRYQSARELRIELRKILPSDSKP